MNYIEIVKLSIKNLWSHKLRTILTILGIILGIGSVVLISSIGAGFKANLLSEVESSLTKVITVNISRKYETQDTNLLRYGLNKNDAKIIENINGVEGIVTYGSIVGTEEKTNTTIRLDAQDDRFPKAKINIIKGRDFIKSDYRQYENSIIIGEETADKLYKNDDPIGKIISINGYDGSAHKFKVVGVARVKKGVLNFFDVGYITSTYYNSNINPELYRMGIYPVLNVRVKNINEIPDVKLRIKTYLQNKNPKSDFYEIKEASSELEDITSILNKISLFINMVAGISLIVGGIGVMNIMLVSVKERISEIGLRKAIGAKNKDIMHQFMLETVILTLIGGIFGITIGYSLAMLIGLIINILPVLTIKMIFISCLISAMVGIVFGIYPAKQAAKLSPMEALRKE